MWGKSRTGQSRSGGFSVRSKRLIQDNFNEWQSSYLILFLAALKNTKLTANQLKLKGIPLYFINKLVDLNILFKVEETGKIAYYSINPEFAGMTIDDIK